MSEQREVKFHNVSPDLLQHVKEGIADKYPSESAALAEDVFFPVGHGYSLKWQYIGTDLVVTVAGPSIFMSKACDQVAALVNGLIGGVP